MNFMLDAEQQAFLLQVLPPDHDLVPALKAYPALAHQQHALVLRIQALTDCDSTDSAEDSADALRQDCEAWCSQVAQYRALAHEAVWMQTVVAIELPQEGE